MLQMWLDSCIDLPRLLLLLLLLLRWPAAARA
jgi:hypothetical protein